MLRATSKPGGFFSKPSKPLPAVHLAASLNSSTAHPAYRAAFDDLIDPPQVTGAGWVRTWPRTSRIPPFTHLDHVLVREAEVVSAGQLTVGGTDHQAGWARLDMTGD